MLLNYVAKLINARSITELLEEDLRIVSHLTNNHFVAKDVSLLRVNPVLSPIILDVLNESLRRYWRHDLLFLVVSHVSLGEFCT